MSRSVHEGFTERFRQSLDEAGYGSTTKKELGVMFGVSPQAVQKWLSGDAIPTAERAPLIAETLGVRRAWLLDAELPMRSLRGEVTEQEQGYATTSGVSLSGDEFKLITVYRKLSRKMQQNVATLLSDISNLQPRK